MVPTKDGRGNYLVARNGDIFHYGDGHSCGSLVSRSIKPHSSIVSMSLSFDGKGYWLVDNYGQVYAFGDAHFYGSFFQPKPLFLPYLIAGIAPTVDGKGYWLTTVFGQVYAFGDAKAYGSLRVQL